MDALSPTAHIVIDVDNQATNDLTDFNYNPNAMEFEYVPSDVELEYPSALSNQKTGLIADPKMYLKNNLEINYVVAKLKIIASNLVEMTINLKYEDFVTLGLKKWGRNECGIY
jgi:hypothetical protein